MAIFDEPLRLLYQDLECLRERLNDLIPLLEYDPNMDTQHRIYHSISRETLTKIMDDFDNAIGDRE